MKVAGIIAEFNPFHNGHKYLIDLCKKEYGADYVVVVMSGDYVQRGAPALVSKFSRAKMALLSGADLVLELPIYYCLGSAEYFAEGALSVLDGLGIITDLFFGSECADIEILSKIADVLVKEPPVYKCALLKALSGGESFPAARTKAIMAWLNSNDSANIDPDFTGENRSSDNSFSSLEEIFSSPNSILALEYLKALKRRDSSIKPHTIKRVGAGYGNTRIDIGNAEHADNSACKSMPNDMGANILASALGLRNTIFENGITKSAKLEQVKESLMTAMPQESLDVLSSYEGSFLDCNSFSDALRYKLFLEKNAGFEKYLDVNSDLSNRIISNLSQYESFDQFCLLLKTKNLTYTRISRCLMHTLLNITEENMDVYKADNFTSYGRILGIKKESSALLSLIHEKSSIPVPGRFKDMEKELSAAQLRLFRETLTGSEIYNCVSGNGIVSEYSLKPIIL
ncbi:MAG: nucleotidyltransferase family protein [Butyrivibrio sp.]|nr:nucleotidyltransferase family protein [Butyrivibrio sp.]